MFFLFIDGIYRKVAYQGHIGIMVLNDFDH